MADAPPSYSDAVNSNNYNPPPSLANDRPPVYGSSQSSVRFNAATNQTFIGDDDAPPPTYKQVANKKGNKRVRINTISGHSTTDSDDVTISYPTNHIYDGVADRSLPEVHFNPPATPPATPPPSTPTTTVTRQRQPAAATPTNTTDPYRFLHIFTFVLAISSVIFSVYKAPATMSTSTCCYTLMRKHFSDDVTYNASDVTYLVYDEHCNYTSAEGNRTHDIGLYGEQRCSEWTVGNAVVWCLAAVSLISAAVQCPSDPNRHEMWMFITRFGSPGLALSGMVVTINALELSTCDVGWYWGMIVFVVCNVLIGLWMCCHSEK